jgi:hypothetical protein
MVIVNFQNDTVNKSLSLWNYPKVNRSDMFSQNKIAT